jgi:hypothetical protein
VILKIFSLKNFTKNWHFCSKYFAKIETLNWSLRKNANIFAENGRKSGIYIPNDYKLYQMAIK